LNKQQGAQPSSLDYTNIAKVMQKPWRAIDITKMLTYISLSQESAFTTHKMATVIFFNYLNDNQPPLAPHYGTWKFLQFSSIFF